MPRRTPPPPCRRSVTAAAEAAERGGVALAALEAKRAQTWRRRRRWSAALEAASARLPRRPPTLRRRSRLLRASLASARCAAEISRLRGERAAADRGLRRRARAPGRDGGCRTRRRRRRCPNTARKHAELIEQRELRRRRVQNAVAQREWPSAPRHDRLEKEARRRLQTPRGARERTASGARRRRRLPASRTWWPSCARSRRRRHRRRRRGAERGAELAAAAEFENAAQQNDMSAKDATAVDIDELVKATKAAEAARRVATDMETFKKIADERLRRIEELESQALDADATRRALHRPDPGATARATSRLFRVRPDHQRRRRRGLPRRRLERDHHQARRAGASPPGSSSTASRRHPRRARRCSRRRRAARAERAGRVQGVSVLVRPNRLGQAAHTMLSEQGALREPRRTTRRRWRGVERFEANAK